MRRPQPKLVVIDNPEGIREVMQHLLDKDFAAYDCETTGLTKRDSVIGVSVCASEDVAYYIILAKWEPKLGTLVPIMGMYEAVTMLIESLAHMQLIMHNGVFDCMMADAFFRIPLIQALHTDTMILAHLLDENRRVGLKELGLRYGEDATAEQAAMKASVEANGGSTTKALYEMYKADSYLMGKYGAKDAWLTFMLFTDLVPELFEQDLDKFFYEDESMPLLRGPTYEMNTTGLKVNMEKLSQLKKQLQTECLEAKDFILQEIHTHIKDKYPGDKKKNHFNIGSSKQLSWLCFGQLGLEFGTLTKEGKNVAKYLVGRVPYTPAAKRDFIAACEHSVGQVYAMGAVVNGKRGRDKKIKQPWDYIQCDKKTLKKFANKYTWIAKLLEYQSKIKLLNTYVEGIESRVQYGIIHPSFLQHGTTSGRYACRNPNFQNLPRDDKRIKSCIEARPGKVFVGADQSQLEPRVFAYISRDERLMGAFDGKSDFYSVAGIEVYDKHDALPLKDGHPNAFGVKYKGLRQDSKVFILASTYGATGHQLAPLMGKTADEAQEDIDKYLEKFPKVKDMMLSSHQMAKKDGQVVNLFGRPRRIPDAKRIPQLFGDKTHKELDYEWRNLLNLAVNHRIQSTGASIVNRVAIRFLNLCKEAEIKVKLVLQVHDSLVAECDEADAENVAVLMQEAMENTIILKGVPFEAIPDIGTNLAEV